MSSGRGFTRLVSDPEATVNAAEDDIQDDLRDRYEASSRFYENFVTGKAGDIVIVDNPTRNADAVRSAEYQNAYMLGTTPFITRQVRDSNGRVRQVHWLKHERFNWWVRFGSGVLFLISAILCLIFALVGPKHFDVETRYTTDWLTNGLTPTGGNGLLNVVGSGKWVWWIMTSFWLSAAIHLFTTGLWVHLWILPRAFYDGTEYPEWTLVYHHWIRSPGNYGYDPTKLSLFIVGWGVIGTVVAQAVGVANILLLLVIFFLICHFGYAFLFAQDWQHSRFAKVFAYSVPHARVGNQVQTAGGSIRESSEIDHQTGRPFLVSAADGLARSPAILAHTLTKGIVGLRSAMGVPPAVRPEKRFARKMQYRVSYEERIERAQRAIDAAPPGSPIKEIRPEVLAVAEIDQHSSADLYDDLYYAFNNPWHMASGWWTWAFIVIVFSCYYFGALHQTSGTFAYWSHTAFWVFMFVLFVFATGYTMFWWWENPILREMSTTDVGPWHFMFSTGFQIFIGFFLLGGAHDVGLIF